MSNIRMGHVQELKERHLQDFGLKLSMAGYNQDQVDNILSIYQLPTTEDFLLMMINDLHQVYKRFSESRSKRYEDNLGNLEVSIYTDRQRLDWLLTSDYSPLEFKPAGYDGCNVGRWDMWMQSDVTGFEDEPDFRRDLDERMARYPLEK